MRREASQRLFADAWHLGELADVLKRPSLGALRDDRFGDPGADAWQELEIGGARGIDVEGHAGGETHRGWHARRDDQAGGRLDAIPSVETQTPPQVHVVGAG